MDTSKKELIKYTLDRIYQQINEDNDNIKMVFDVDGIDIFLCTKMFEDDDYSFTVEVIKPKTDVKFSNFVFNGTRNELKNYLQTQNCVEKVESCIETLVKKARS